MIHRRRTVLSAVAVSAVMVVYFAVDPMQSRLMPKCPFLMLTGYSCPGCGAQRLLHSLLHGDIAGAWQANALLLLSLPLLLFMVWADLSRRRHPRIYAGLNSTGMVIAISVVIVIWFIVRNILGI